MKRSTLVGMTIGLALITLIPIGVLVSNVDDREKAQRLHVETVCHVESVEVRDHRCCELGDCSCSEAPTSAMDCGTAIRDLNQTVCGNGNRCCEETCRTCQSCSRRAVRERCDSGWHRYCTHYKTVCDRFPCNCSCAESVTNDMCRTVCGVCHELGATYSTTVAPWSWSFFPKSTCGRDDTECVARWEAEWVAGTDRPCWWSVSDKRVTFTEPEIPGLNIGAVVSVAVLGTIVVVGCVKAIRTSGDDEEVGSDSAPATDDGLELGNRRGESTPDPAQAPIQVPTQNSDPEDQTKKLIPGASSRSDGS